MEGLRISEGISWPPRREVFNFSLAMEEKLDENDDKGHWDGCTEAWLLNRLKQETGELRRAIKKNKPALEVLREAADVANFAMMIADVYGSKEINGDYL